MNADQLLARLEADLLTAHILRQAERPTGGLTASRLLGCSSAAARILLREPEGSTGDFYRGLRGTWTHDGLADDLARVDPGFTDGRGERFTWDPGGGLPVITGEADFFLDENACEVKTRPKAECRWHADHGPDPQHAAQVSAAAAAKNFRGAFVVYLPTDAGLSEVAVCEVDVAHWLRETVHWLHRVDVRDEVEEAVRRGTPREQAVRQALDPIPREPAVTWCREFCPFAGPCRGDYSAPEDAEILDPVVRLAAEEASRWRDVRLDAERREKAAKSRLAHAEGRVTPAGEGGALDVRQTPVAATEKRRGHVKTTVTRRPS